MNFTALTASRTATSCTAEDIARMTGLHINEVSKYLAALVGQGGVRTRRGRRGIFYQMIPDN